jgi:hypothetical protein
MLTSLFSDPGSWHFLLASPFYLAVAVFQIWMLIHAVRNREWIWAVIIFIGSGLGALWYYLSIYRNSASATGGFELPGAQRRERIKQLQA